MQRRLTAEERQQTPDPLSAFGATSVDDGRGPINPDWVAQPIDAPPARVDFSIIDPFETQIIGTRRFTGGSQVVVPTDPNARPMQVSLSPEQIKTLEKVGRFYVQITPVSVASQYGLQMPTSAADSPVVMAVPDSSNSQKLHFIATSAVGDDTWSPIEFRGRSGNFGQQLKGGPRARAGRRVYVPQYSPASRQRWQCAV